VPYVFLITSLADRKRRVGSEHCRDCTQSRQSPVRKQRKL